MSRQRVIEVKRALDGAGASERRFECELVDASASRAVVLYRFTRDGRALDSYGVFWRRRPYNCYYAVAPAASWSAGPVFVRFDVVRDVEIELGAAVPEVRYTDLLLDLWVDEHGARWEDAEEVEALARSGVLTDADARRIESARGVLERGHRRITAEVRGILQRAWTRG